MFNPDIHERSVPFRGNADAAFDLARTTVLSQGFTIVTDTHDELTAVGPGMQSNRQSPLLGASRLRLRVISSTIVGTATLGGVATMKKFVYLFPPGLFLALFLTFRLVGMSASPLILLGAAPWLLIAPLLASAIKRKTTRSIDALVGGMARVAERKG
jgi:hypothetical protein